MNTLTLQLRRPVKTLIIFKRYLGVNDISIVKYSAQATNKRYCYYSTSSKITCNYLAAMYCMATGHL